MDTKNSLVDEILALDVSIGAVEQHLGELKKRQADVERRLVELCETEDITAFTSEDGKKVSRRDTLYVTMRAEDKEGWFHWIEMVGRGDLIKTDVNKRSFTALVKNTIADGGELPSFCSVTNDLFFKPHIDIKLGKKSLRRAAANAGADSLDQNEF